MRIWAKEICNLYWVLRNRREWDHARRRRYYRYIAAEKKRLIESGVDPELVRLLCRSMANPDNKRAKAIFENYEAQLKLPLELS